MPKPKITKLMIWPTRSINLGNFNSAKLSAGVEIEFDKPVAMNSKEVKKAFEESRKVIKEEFKAQYEPYREVVNKLKEAK